MKRVLAFIAAANQVLLFLGILAGLVLLTFALIEEFGTPRERGVPLQDAAEVGRPPAVTVVDFLGRHRGIYIFGVGREFVAPPSGITMMQATSSFAKAGGYRSGYLNITFSDDTGVRRTLLPQDGLILRHAFASDGDDKRQGFPVHVFTCVLEDTNNNRQLDSDDRKTLVLVRDDLSGDDLRIDDVNDYDVLSSQELVVTTGSGAATRAWRIDTHSLERRELPWEKK